MTDDIETVAIGYADRFKWQNAMRAQPRSVLTADTKNVLAAILECMDRRTQIAAKTYKHLARMTGLKESGARACCDKAEAAGWIKGKGKGGIIYDETGKPHGLAKRFTLTVPATAIARCTGDTCDENGTYLLWNPDLPAMKLADTCYGHSTNTLSSSPSLSPISSPSVQEHFGDSDRDMERTESISSIPSNSNSTESERESEPYSETSSTSPMDTARAIVLPVATAEQRGAWGDAWPAEDKVMRRIQDWDTAYKLVGNEAVRVLNISTEEDARMPEGSEHRYMDAHINATLSDEHRRALATGLQRGDLRYVEMASVLAHYGFKPRAEERREAKREAQS